MTPQIRREPMSRAEALAEAEKAQRHADACIDADPTRASLWATVAESYRLIARVAEERGDTGDGAKGGVHGG